MLAGSRRVGSLGQRARRGRQPVLGYNCFRGCVLPPTFKVGLVQLLHLRSSRSRLELGLGLSVAWVGGVAASFVLSALWPRDGDQIFVPVGS
jgi:hypothetical protein